MRVQRKSRKRKQYPSEFKREAVRLMTGGRLKMAQVARDLALTDNLVRHWALERARLTYPDCGRNHEVECDEVLDLNLSEKTTVVMLVSAGKAKEFNQQCASGRG